MYGTVYSSGCTDEGKECKYAVKIQVYSHDFMNEVKFLQKMSSIQIGPIYYGAWTCLKGTIGIIVTELWDKSYHQYLIEGHKPTFPFFTVIVDQIKKIHDNGYIHRDLHHGNILLKIGDDNSITDVAITDFGKMIEFKNIDKDKRETEKLFNHMISLYPAPFTSKKIENFTQIVDNKGKIKKEALELMDYASTLSDNYSSLTEFLKDEEELGSFYTSFEEEEEEEEAKKKE